MFLPSPFAFLRLFQLETMTGQAYSKLRETVYNNSSVAYIKDYTGGAVYTDQILDFFHMDEGRVKHASGSFSYEYFLKDHLGNTRVAFTPLSMATEYSKITQEDHYYPFGMSTEVKTVTESEVKISTLFPH